MPDDPSRDLPMLREQLRQLEMRQNEDRIAMQRLADTITITNRLQDVTAEKLKNIDTKVDRHVEVNADEHKTMWGEISGAKRMFLLLVCTFAGAIFTFALNAIGKLPT